LAFLEDACYDTRADEPRNRIVRSADPDLGAKLELPTERVDRVEPSRAIGRVGARYEGDHESQYRRRRQHP